MGSAALTLTGMLMNLIFRNFCNSAASHTGGDLMAPVTVLPLAALVISASDKNRTGE